MLTLEQFEQFTNRITGDVSCICVMSDTHNTGYLSRDIDLNRVTYIERDAFWNITVREDYEITLL